MVLGQNLGQIMSNVLKKVKKQAISLGVFRISLGDYLLKQEALVVKPLEWKFMPIIARNPNFNNVRAKFLPNLGQKWQKTDNIQ